jgi:hypothetical protein
MNVPARGPESPFWSAVPVSPGSDSAGPCSGPAGFTGARDRHLVYLLHTCEGGIYVSTINNLVLLSMHSPVLSAVVIETF